jgi:hypothetical protein
VCPRLRGHSGEGLTKGLEFFHFNRLVIEGIRWKSWRKHFVGMPGFEPGGLAPFLGNSSLGATMGSMLAIHQ